MAEPVIAIVGGNSLMGRELREVAHEEFPHCRLELIGAEDSEAGILTEAGGEATILTPLDAEHLADAAVVVLASTPESSVTAAGIVRERQESPSIVDFTYAFEDQPGSRIRAPQVEDPREISEQGAVQVIAHPAAVVVATLLRTLQARYPVRHSVIQIFEPASERGQAGVMELQDQSISLLSFKKMPKKVFDEQAGFSLLSRYGEDAPVSLSAVEQRIEQHLTTLLSGAAELCLPSLKLSHAPVFHGYTISAWVEFQKRPDASEIERLLATAGFDVRGKDLDPPNNVGMAGHGGIATGAVEADRNHASAIWLWMVADNFRMMAETGIPVIKEFLERQRSR